MSTLQVHEAIQTTDTSVTFQRSWRCILLLNSLFGLLVIISALFILAAPQSDDRIAPFLLLPMGFFTAFASEQGQNAGVTQQVAHSVVAVRYVTTTVLLRYFFHSVQSVPLDWTIYDRLVYWPAMIA